ncbi:MAG TPA: DegQ family serine endoprotease [Burkholderiales bacterium]|nr:DegQ family serine endoprotease [Burkholderiales bacterium]
MKRKRLMVALAAAGLFALGAWGGMEAVGLPAWAHSEAQAAVSAPAAEPMRTVQLPDFTSIVKANKSAVVNITVVENQKTAASPQAQIPDFPNDPFWQFFRHFQVPEPQGPTRGLGSGFIVSPDGIILTNAHVVDNSHDITVKLSDRRELKAKVIGVDKLTDIAVLKIDAHNLPTIKLGDSNSVQVGQWVIAIGSPYGFENTVTAGIVSATSRALPDGTYVPFIQTDAPVNPGNSGGPLINMNGQVIGINSQIYSQTGGFQGLSFAIPIDVAKNVEQQILAHGKVERGRIGVTIQEVTQPLAQSFGLKQPTGALVSSVDPNGPAAKAGVQSGDVILAFNGTRVDTSAQLPPIVAAVKPGTDATLQVWRHGATKDLTVKVGKLTSKQIASIEGGNKAEQGRLGLAVRPLTPDEKQQAEVTAGLLVEQVSGPAADAGIQQGDIILAVNGTPVKSIAQLREIIAKAGKHVALLIQRDDAKIFVPVDLG